jgi:hypothetical protein
MGESDPATSQIALPPLCDCHGLQYQPRLVAGAAEPNAIGNYYSTVSIDLPYRTVIATPRPFAGGRYK